MKRLLKKLTKRSQLRGALPGFDPDFYVASNPDAAVSKQNALEHFLVSGWREGRDPSASFHMESYLRVNPDVREAGMNPLVHFVEYGLREGRMGWHREVVSEPAPDLKPAPAPDLKPEPAPDLKPEPALDLNPEPAPDLKPRVDLRSDLMSEPKPGLVGASRFAHSWSSLPPTPKAVAEALYWLLDQEADPGVVDDLVGLPSRADVRRRLLCSTAFRRAVAEIAANGHAFDQQRVKAWRSAAAGSSLPVLAQGKVLDIKSGLADLAVWGWHPAENWGLWNNGSHSLLALRLAPDLQLPLQVSIKVRLYPPRPARQAVKIFFDHELVALVAEPGVFSFTIVEMDDHHDHLLTFEVDSPVSPQKFAGVDDVRQLGVGIEFIKASE